MIDEGVAEPEIEPEVADDTAPPDAPPSRALLTSLAALCAVFLVAVIVLSIVAVDQHDARNKTDADRHRIEQVASSFAQRLLTYDYRHLDDAKAKVLAFAAGKFRDDYQSQFPALQQLITAAQSTQAGHPKEVYVSSSDADNAKVIVVSDIENDGKAGHRTRDNAYVQLTLVKVGGTWKVVDVGDLNFSQEDAGTSSTTTTVPGK